MRHVAAYGAPLLMEVIPIIPQILHILITFGKIKYQSEMKQVISFAELTIHHTSSLVSAYNVIQFKQSIKDLDKHIVVIRIFI